MILRRLAPFLRNLRPMRKECVRRPRERNGKRTLSGIPLSFFVPIRASDPRAHACERNGILASARTWTIGRIRRRMNVASRIQLPSILLETMDEIRPWITYQVRHRSHPRGRNGLIRLQDRIQGLLSCRAFHVLCDRLDLYVGLDVRFPKRVPSRSIQCFGQLDQDRNEGFFPPTIRNQRQVRGKVSRDGCALTRRFEITCTFPRCGWKR